VARASYSNIYQLSNVGAVMLPGDTEVRKTEKWYTFETVDNYPYEYDEYPSLTESFRTKFRTRTLEIANQEGVGDSGIFFAFSKGKKNRQFLNLISGENLKLVHWPNFKILELRESRSGVHVDQLTLE
jgi:hypothetical protein